MSYAEIVYDILDKIDTPSGEGIFFPKGRNLPKKFVEYKDKDFVAGLDHRQSVLLGQEISKQAGERYTLLPLQVSYDKIHSDGAFKQMMRDYWIWNREVLFEKGEILPDPVVKEVEGKLVYEGKTIPVKIDKSDVFETLINSGFHRKPEQRFYGAEIKFKDGICVVMSDWVCREGPFEAATAGPSDISYYHIAAFLKTYEKV
jgi:hypothetical protein